MKLLILSLLSFFVFEANANIFVGNGGQGVEIEKKLFLRDLVSAGVHEAPYIGSERDPQLPELPGEPTIDFAYPKELLARKLTDLNSAIPGLGDYLLAAMKVYSWRLQDFPLTEIRDQQSPIALPSGASLVQLANRFQTSIRIHRQSWERLDDSNKVALLIHEVTFSLLRVSDLDDGHQYQSAQLARELTGSFFSLSYLSLPQDVLATSLSTILSIPKRLVALKYLRSPGQWVVYSPSVDFIYIVPEGKKSDDFYRAVASACSVADRTQKEHSLEEVSVFFQPRPIALTLSYYRASDRNPVSQAAINILDDVVSLDGLFVHTYKSNEACLEQLSNQLFRFSKDEVWK